MNLFPPLSESLHLALGWVAVLVFLAACAPQVQLTTPEPVRIDVNMNVKIETELQETPKTTPTRQVSPREGRRYRMGEVQALKNDRVIGETMDGLLEIVQPPQDPAYLEYAQRIVREENADREAVFLDDATRFNKSIEVVRREFAQRAAERSFVGEWIQTPEGWTTK